MNTCTIVSAVGDPRDELRYMVQLLNQGAYQAAFERWHDAPESSLSAFEAHFQSIQTMTATLQLPRGGGGGGSIYNGVPTHLLIQERTGQLREEDGCIVLSRSNPSTDGADPGDWWQIDSSLSSVPLFTTADPGASQITPGAPCPGAPLAP